MAIERKDAPETAREEDYRDFEARDIEDGWPYSDADGDRQRKKNAAYGQPPAGFETDDNPGIEVAGETAILSEGGPALGSAVTHDAIDDDGLEETIADRLSMQDRVDDDQITVTVHDGIAEIAGSVETEGERQFVDQLIIGISGVRDTRNRLVLSGVDSHIPSDATD